jgi:YfiH family protein
LTVATINAPALLRPEWPAPVAVRTAFTLRAGGVSAGRYASLNLGDHVGDAPRAVAENRRRLAAALRLPAEPLWLAQVHGTTVLAADDWVAAGEPGATGQGATGHGVAPQADGAVTRRAGCVLAVLVADCLPLLLARRDGGAVAVAHAGWRGLAAGVIEATVAALGAPGEELLAWLGPAIGPAHFEVGEEVREAFCQHDPQAAHALVRNARGRWQCDLPLLARQRLAALGVRGVYGEGRCTYGEPDAFYSYRRDGATGRMAALIWLAPRLVPPAAAPE